MDQSPRVVIYPLVIYTVLEATDSKPVSKQLSFPPQLVIHRVLEAAKNVDQWEHHPQRQHSLAPVSWMEPKWAPFPKRMYWLLASRAPAHSCSMCTWPYQYSWSTNFIHLLFRCLSALTLASIYIPVYPRKGMTLRLNNTSTLGNLHLKNTDPHLAGLHITWRPKLPDSITLTTASQHNQHSANRNFK